MYSIWETMVEPPWGKQISVVCNVHKDDATIKRHDVTLIRKEGQQRKVIATCACHELAEILLQIGFFPCTAKVAQIAIDMDIMEEYHLLNVMCDVSNHSYAGYLTRKSTTVNQANQSDIYRSIQRCYRPWSLLYQQSQRLSNDFNESLRIECPVCQPSGNATITLDACFGATSMARNSRLDIEPQQDHDYLLKDLSKEVIGGSDQTDDFEDALCFHMASKTTNNRMDSSYFAGLHYTGLMGSICKHGMPLWFLNISHGKEKAVFGAKILEYVQSLNFSGIWNVKYDIMCT